MSGEWPDELTKADADSVAKMLAAFWHGLTGLADLVERHEQYLCAELLGDLRATVLGMMLALNGISRPARTRYLNAYLSDKQRAALERTLILPAPNREGWVGQAVALIVIYRWYAPQLATAYGVPYPEDAEESALRSLSEALPEWPRTINTG